MVRSLPEIIAQNDAACKAATPPEQLVILGVVQQGGTTWEFYIHGFDNQEEVAEYHKSCDEATYSYTNAFDIKPSVWDPKRKAWLFTETDVMTAIQNALDALVDIGYA